MDGSDLFDLYGDDQALAKARADALARRAQGLQGAGLILHTLAGDRDPAGGTLEAMGQRDLDQVAQGIQHGATTRIQERHLGVQEQQMENMLRHQQAMEDIAAGRLAQGDTRLGLTAESLRQRGFKYNPNTGQWEQPAGPLRAPVAPNRMGPLTAVPPASGVSQSPTPAPAPSPASAAAPPPSPAAGAGSPAAPGGGPAGSPQFPPAGGKILDKRLKELGADFDPNGGRAGEFGKNQARINASRRLLALATDAQGNPRDLNPQQMPELAQGLAALISGGSAGAQAQIEHLTPQSLRGDAAKIAQWLTNEPTGTGQQEFVRNMVETAKREADVAQQGLDMARKQRAAKHQAVLLGNPVEARRVLQGFGWDLGPDGVPVLQGATAAAPAQRAQGKDGKWYINRGSGWEAE